MIEAQGAEFVREDGKVFLVIDHDKGRTVLRMELDPSHHHGFAFVAHDSQSAGALADLLRDC